MDNLVELDKGGENEEALLEQMGKLDFFSDLDADELKTFAKWATVYSAKQGDTIFKEGTAHTDVCFIVEGEVAISKQVSPFESIKISDIAAGGVIGEMGIMDGEAISASAKASRDTVVVIISDEDFKQLVRENGDLGAKLLWKIGRIITARLRQTTSMLADLSMSKSSRMLKY